MQGRRYGGRYSPAPAAEGPETPAGSRVTAPPAPQPRPRGRWRAWVLFALAVLILIAAFAEPPHRMLLRLSRGGLLVLAAWLSHQGITARAAWEARTLARRPAIPRLLFASLATGAALFIGGAMAHGLMSPYPVLFALAGVVLHLGAFGLDPMRDKGMEGVDRFQTDRAARAIAEAEATLAQMADAIARTADRGLIAHVARFADQARQLMRRVEEDPGDLTAARKYLSVYLQGARDATARFADVWTASRDAKARSDYEALLSDLETTFAERSQALLGNDRDRLDVEIAVLRDRLKFETPAGVSPPPQA